MLRINPNSKIESMIDHLSGYNTPKSGTQRQIALNKESISINGD